MNFTITYQERALNEYENAVAWYRERSEVAAENFKNSVSERIDMLRIDPFRYRNTYKNFREVSLKKYPYSLIFLVDDVEYRIIISSIFHHKRSPRKKFKK